MLINIRTIAKRKGQGIVEYALLLAFVVGIAMMLQGVGLAGAVKDTFDSVASLLGGEKKGYAYGLEQLSGMSKKAVKEKSSQEERIKMDQEALAKIGEFFLDKTSGELSSILKTVKTNAPNENIFLVNYHDGAEVDAETFTTDFNYDGSQFKSTGYYDILGMMQGEKPNGQTDHDKVQESSSRYFFSDNMLDQSTSTAQWVNDRSIRVNLHFDNTTDRVDAVRVKVNRGDSKATNPSVTNYYRELDVKVGKDKGWKQTIAGDPGAINLNTSTSVNNTWYDLNNW